MICKQNGFSLLEVLISFLLIGIGSLGLIKLQSYVEQRSDYAVRSIEALHFAEKQLEFFRRRTQDLSGATNLIDFSKLDVVAYHHGFGVYYCLGDLPEMVAAGYSMSCSAYPVPDAVSQSVKALSVTVSWTDRLKQHQSITLNTMISKYSEFD